MFNHLLKKIIRSASGRVRFVLAMVAMSVAALLILAAVQLQANYQQLLFSNENRDTTANFIVINREVTDATVNQTSLTAEEITDLKKQPFAEAVGVLTPSTYKISVQSIRDDLPFSSDLFFESVPTSFLDINPEQWQWKEGSNFLPMIIPAMFMDMYNFGFATSQDLPKLTPELIKLLPVQVNIKSAAENTQFVGRVVGFSNRITSVLVPQEFMDYANKRWGSAATGKTTRVIVKTTDASNPLLTQYLKKHQLVSNIDKSRFSKYRQIVELVVKISWISGAVMLLFALLIFTLFIQLTVYSCKAEIELLILLGASPGQLEWFLFRRFFPSNIYMIFSSLILLSALQYKAAEWLGKQQILVSNILSVNTLIGAISMLAVLATVNFYQIRKSIYQKK
jgi:hypothetical protein